MYASPAYVLALVVAVLVGKQDRPFEAESAYHEDGALRFVPRAQVDWAAMASPELRNLPIPTADADIVARFAPLIDMFGNVEVRGSVSTPAPLATRHFYFAGADGIRSIAVDSTRVVTRLGFNPQGTRLQGRQSYGEMFGSPLDGDLGEGGLILHSERPLSFQASSSNVSADDLLLGSTAVQQTSDGGYWGRGTAFWEIETQYRFALEAVPGEWVFVQWAPDREMMEAGCRYRYQLFHLAPDGAASPVAWTSYGCDV